MFKIYVSSDDQQIKASRLWRVTAPNGAINHIFGTMHIENSSLLLAGSPEFNHIFSSSDNILFEFADMHEIRKTAIRSLEYALNFKVDEQLLQESLNIKKKYPAEYNDFIETTSNSIYQYFTTNHPQYQIDLNKLQSLHFMILGGLFQRLVIYKEPQLEIFDNVLFQEAKYLIEMNNKNVKGIESFDMLLQSDYNSAKISDLVNIFDALHLMTKEKYTSKRSRTENIEWEKLYYSGELYKMVDSNPSLSKQFEMRNELMVQAFMPSFIEGNSLLCTGLSHCSGKKGFLQLLKDQKYKIEAVIETPNLRMINKNIYNELLSAMYALGYIAMALTAFDSELRDEKYLATVAVTICALLVEMDSLEHLEKFGLAYNVVNLMLTPGLTSLAAIASLAPLSMKLIKNIKSNLEMGDLLVNNCGPEHLRSEQSSRAYELYTSDAKPVVSRTMLTQFARNNAPVFENIDNKAAAVQTVSRSLSLG